MAAAVVAALGLALTLGLLGGTPTGAADNGDGFRLFCGAGLVPRTPTHVASWQGGVVLDFDHGMPCKNALPSSGTVILKAVAGGHGVFSLTKLGWFYVMLVFLVTVLAAWAVTAHGRRRILFLVPLLVPLLDPDFARVFISTMGEAAGLFGAYTLLCGVAVIAATKVEDGFERLSALALVAVGGVIAGLARIGFLPLFVLAVVVCLVTGARAGRGRWWSGRIFGPALACLLVLEIITPVRADLAWQDRNFGEVNTVDLVYTLALVEMPGSAPELGLPADAQDSAGRAFFPNGLRDLVGADAVKNDPTGIEHKVWGMVLARPDVLAHAVAIGLQSTYGRSLAYLPDTPWTPATVAPVGGGPASGDTGADPQTFQQWLDDMGLPWWPPLLLLLGMAGAVVALVRRRRWTTRYGIVAGVATTSALGIVVMAVVGDGYYEIAKHVWLAAYLLDVTALSLCVMAVPVLARRAFELRERRRRWVRAPVAVPAETPPEPVPAGSS
ncbi:MAG: hypothetical protein JWQ81_58 [Amycolatopsis sp.]|nr:hypothetical protein [Amycolatopsis sp.]